MVSVEKASTSEDIWHAFFNIHLSTPIAKNRGQVVTASTLIVKSKEYVKDVGYVVTHEYRAKSAVDLSLKVSDRLTVTDDQDPQWWHGFKRSDPARRLGIFPKYCVAKIQSGEIVAQVREKVSLIETDGPSAGRGDGSKKWRKSYRRKTIRRVKIAGSVDNQPSPIPRTLRLYRDQIVFITALVRMDKMKIRTEHNRCGVCPFSNLHILYQADVLEDE